MKKTFVSFMILLTIICGCTAPKTPGDTLFVGLGSAPTSLDPRSATDANSQRITDLIFSSLVRSGPDLKPMAEAALSWKIEKKKITFKLRQDLVFSNGAPVKMSDIISSIGEYIKPTSPSATALALIDKIESPDNKETLVLYLKEDDGALLTNLSLVKILPEGTQHTVGSGPYLLSKIDNGQMMLTRAPHQSYAHPKIDRIIFQFVRDDQTRYLKMLKGELDLLSNELPEDKVIALKNSGQTNVTVSPGLNINYLLLNLRDEKFKNVAFRHALLTALDREEIVKYKLEGLADVALSLLSPANPFTEAKLKISPMTLEQAKLTVSEAQLNGKEISLKTSDQAITNGLILGRQLEKLGVHVNVQGYEWGTYYNDVKSGRYQMALMRWVGVFDPDLYRDTLSTKEFVPGRNRGYYSNAAFDKLVDTGRHEMDFEKRRVIYSKAQQIIVDEMPIIPLWYNANISCVSKRVRGFKPIVTGSFYPFLDVTKE